MITNEHNLEESEQESIENRVDATLIKICPVEMMDQLRELIFRMPATFRAREHVVRKKVKPNMICDQLRLSFWIEYSRALRLGRRMKLSNVLRYNCTKPVWNQVIKKNRLAILWIACPPQSVKSGLRQILNGSIERLVLLLQVPSIDPRNGKLRAANASVVIRVMSALTVLPQSFD